MCTINYLKIDDKVSEEQDTLFHDKNNRNSSRCIFSNRIINHDARWIGEFIYL